jgi:HAD superfamily hydrolase (TIGR01549 family)
MSVATRRIPVFDLDGTLVDSDLALVAPFVALGVPAEEVTFGHVLADECERLGLTVADYLAHYDDQAASPFAGVEDLLGRLDRWAVCSNKHPASGRAELERLGWAPEVALFSDAFAGPKQLGPVLDAMALGPDEIVFVGDTAHDRIVADGAGAPFALAGWNPRAEPRPGDVVLARPVDLLEVLAPASAQ